MQMVRGIWYCNMTKQAEMALMKIYKNKDDVNDVLEELDEHSKSISSELSVHYN